jgi:hypothetical protein
VRLFDLMLAVLVLIALVLIARREFPGYDGRTFSPPAAEVPAAPSPSPAP